MLVVYLLVFFVCWLYTLLGTTDIANWIIENSLTVLFLATLFLTYPLFKFNAISYSFIFLFMLMHIYGAMYSYAENPLGYWIKNIAGMHRNNYDRLVHFCYGFMLSYPMRDYFSRWFGWPYWVCLVLPCLVMMAFSGIYEVIEWVVANIFFPAQGMAYLGIQGDVWDAQKDMALAFGGAIFMMCVTAGIKKI